MAFTVQDFEDMLRILEEKPEWQQRMRQAILTRELLELPARFEQLVETVKELVEAQRRTDARVDELAGIVQELVQISRDALRRLERLENWQQGETDRWEDELYERDLAARAQTLRQVGVDATPVVIGEEWGTPDTEAIAQQEGVEWYVRGGLSSGFLEFRKLPDGYEAN